MPGLEQQHTFLIVGLYTTCNVPPTTPMVAQRISRGRGACGDGGVDYSGGWISVP